MSTQANYYSSQLQRVSGNSEYPRAIRVVDWDGTRTNYLNLNGESASILHEWLTDHYVINEYPDRTQKELSNIEIEGLISMFNEFYKDYCEQKDHSYVREGFYWCEGYLNSESDTNGTPIKFEGWIIDGLAKRAHGESTYIRLRDKKGFERLCEFNKYNGQWYILGTKKSGKVF